MTDTTDEDTMTRLEALLNLYGDKKAGSVNPDLMVAVNSYHKVQEIKQQLRFAEAALDHAVRGLDHRDYDSTFEGWARVDDNGSNANNHK